jgi:hypothetical protein
MNKVACLLVAAALCGPCFAQDANKTPVAANAKTVTITGTIKNFDEFKAAVVPETYIQLVPQSADGRFPVTYGAGGLIRYDSILPRFPVPKNAAFSFNVPNIPPGKYVIAAQYLQGGQGLFKKANGQATFIIDISTDAKSPITISTGDVTVRIH